MRRQAILAVVLALVAQAGCKSQGPPKPMDCSVIPPAIDRIMADRASDPRVAAVLPQHKQEMVALCEEEQEQNAEDHGKRLNVAAARQLDETAHHVGRAM